MGASCSAVRTRWWMVFIKDAVKDWKAKTLFKATIMTLEWVLEDVTGDKKMGLAKVEVLKLEGNSAKDRIRKNKGFQH